MKRALAARTIPDLIKKLCDHVREDMAADDDSALELLGHLELAWCEAERWRIEQWDAEFECAANGQASSPSSH